jgi:hypothetical protein
VEGAAHAQGDNLRRAACLGVIERPDDRFAPPANHYLARRVDVADFGAGFAADFLAIRDIEPQDSGHRAGISLAGRLHQFATGAKQANGLIER